MESGGGGNGPKPGDKRTNEKNSEPNSVDAKKKAVDRSGESTGDDGPRLSF